VDKRVGLNFPEDEKNSRIFDATRRTLQKSWPYPLVNPTSGHLWSDWVTNSGYFTK